MLVCFLTRDRKIMHPKEKGGVEELGGVRRRETIIRICYIKIYFQ